MLNLRVSHVKFCAVTAMSCLEARLNRTCIEKVVLRPWSARVNTHSGVPVYPPRAIPAGAIENATASANCRATSNTVRTYRGVAMLQAELNLSTFRVFAAAIQDEPGGDFKAAAVVVSLGRHGLPVEVVFRDDALDDGRLWADAGAAVRFGLEVGQAAAHNQRALAGLADRVGACSNWAGDSVAGH